MADLEPQSDDHAQHLYLRPAPGSRFHPHGGCQRLGPGSPPMSKLSHSFIATCGIFAMVAATIPNMADARRGGGGGGGGGMRGGGGGGGFSRGGGGYGGGYSGSSRGMSSGVRGGSRSSV